MMDHRGVMDLSEEIKFTVYGFQWKSEGVDHGMVEFARRNEEHYGVEHHDK
jgi:hypothetical protein